MAEHDTEPPILTAKDVEKVTSLIDPEPLPCGGRGLIETLPNGKAVPGVERWSFGRRAPAAVARLYLGLGWTAPRQPLRLVCPAGIARCVTHRTVDATLPGTEVTDELSNGVTTPQNRAPTAPGGNGSDGGVRADEALLRGTRWATGATPASRADPTPEPQHGASSPPPSGLTPPLSPDTSQVTPGDRSPGPPKGGPGERHQVAGDKVTVTAKVPTPRRRLRKLLTGRGARARAAKTTAAVAVALAAVFAASRCTGAIDRLELPTDTGTTLPVQAPTTPDPLLPPDPTATPTAPPSSAIGPVFRVCPPSWETTSVPLEGCP